MFCEVQVHKLLDAGVNPLRQTTVHVVEMQALETTPAETSQGVTVEDEPVLQMHSPAAPEKVVVQSPIQTPLVLQFPEASPFVI